MHLIIATLLTALLSITAHAEVLNSNDAGFISQHVMTTATDKSTAFEAMTNKVGLWWNPDHSFSGDAANMQIDAQCFCERWGSNLVHHLNTEIWIENSKVVMAGGLGPLKELGLSGMMVWSLTTNEHEQTAVNWNYHVFGYSETDMQALASAVDAVLAEQLGRLADYLGTQNQKRYPQMIRGPKNAEIHS
jgi:hypothetical protein